MEFGSRAGNYFKVRSSQSATQPSFARYFCRVDGGIPGEELYFVEAWKKTTTRNKDWKACFGEGCRVDALTRTQFCDLLDEYEEGERVHEEQGESCRHKTRRETGRVNGDFKLKSTVTEIWEPWIDRLVETDDWLQVKHDLCMEDAGLLPRWEVLTEAARVRLQMASQKRRMERVAQSVLRYWQAQLLTLIERKRTFTDGRPDDRTVIWIYDTAGGTGKTWFARFLAQLRPLTTKWLHNGPTKDMIKSVADSVRTVTTVMFDLSRCNMEKINWDAIERIKNGMIMSTKYHVETHIIDSPAVVCFANYPPELDRLSADRWAVYCVEKEVLMEQLVDVKNGEATLGGKSKYDAPDDAIVTSFGVTYQEAAPPIIR